MQDLNGACISRLARGMPSANQPDRSGAVALPATAFVAALDHGSPRPLAGMHPKITAQKMGICGNILRCGTTLGRVLSQYQGDWSRYELGLPENVDPAEEVEMVAGQSATSRVGLLSASSHVIVDSVRRATFVRRRTDAIFRTDRHVDQTFSLATLYFLCF